MNLTTTKLKDTRPMGLKHNENCGYYYDNICKCDYWDEVRPNAKRYGLYEQALANRQILGGLTETD
tara:strand:- start:12696 stop:12893 length:198 start_codon:yes stop_codon:yes gene_type:complete